MRKICIATLLAFLAAPFLSLAASSAAPDPDEEAKLDAYIDFLRQEIKDGKTQLITDTMKLTVDEAAEFWPIYRAYQQRRKEIGDRRLQLIKDYARHANDGTLDDEAANDILTRALALDEERLVLMRNFATKIAAALSAERAAQFYQVESRIDAVVDVTMDAEIPLLELSERTAGH